MMQLLQHRDMLGLILRECAALGGGKALLRFSNVCSATRRATSDEHWELALVRDWACDEDPDEEWRSTLMKASAKVQWLWLWCHGVVKIGSVNTTCIPSMNCDGENVRLRFLNPIVSAEDLIKAMKLAVKEKLVEDFSVKNLKHLARAKSSPVGARDLLHSIRYYRPAYGGNSGACTDEDEDVTAASLYLNCEETLVWATDNADVMEQFIPIVNYARDWICFFFLCVSPDGRNVAFYTAQDTD